jgi:hypothetical protein
MQRLARVSLAFAALAIAILFLPKAAVEADPGNSITSPDTAWVGEHTSLALDSLGNPVISYMDAGNADLKVMHCNDPNCDPTFSGNGPENITSPDTMGNVGYYTSLALDADGNPVVSYRRPNSGPTVGALKVLHCATPYCNGSSIMEPDPGADGGVTSSLILDASGNPVVSHFDGDAAHLDLRLVHCNDAACANGGESLTAPDTVGYVGSGSSLALDADGNPVVSYQHGDGYLKLLHCDDPNCSGNESGNIEIPDASGNILQTSLELDSSGGPVVSYYEHNNGDLKVLHCNDPNCDPTVNGPESITSPDTTGDVGSYSSLELDASGNPVVSYYCVNTGDLKVLHCNDPNCNPTVNGPESIAAADTTDNVGLWTSLALDASGDPVVSYYDSTNMDLKVLHCDSPACGATGPAGGIAELADVAEGNSAAQKYVALAGGVAALLALTAGAWYAKRR